MRRLYSKDGGHINYVPIENLFKGREDEWGAYSPKDDPLPPIETWVGLGISHYGESGKMTGEISLFFWNGTEIEDYGVVKIDSDKTLVRE